MNKNQLLTELRFKATRSSGPGGQHVNKTSTRVTLSWSLEQTLAFSEDKKNRLKNKLANRITKDGYLLLVSQNNRSQYKNKVDVITRFFNLLETGLKPVKPRKKTNPSITVKRKRLKAKKIQANKKANRKKPML